MFDIKVYSGGREKETIRNLDKPQVTVLEMVFKREGIQYMVKPIRTEKPSPRHNNCWRFPECRVERSIMREAEDLITDALLKDGGFDERWIPLADGKAWELHLWTDEETGHKVGQLYGTKIDGGGNLTADTAHWITIYHTAGECDEVTLV